MRTCSECGHELEEPEMIPLPWNKQGMLHHKPIAADMDEPLPEDDETPRYFPAIEHERDAGIGD